MKNLTASDRSSLIRLAASLPVGDENRRAILAGLVEAKTAAEAPESVNALMATLGRVPGVANVYITDTWSDGYFHLRVVLDPKESKNVLGGWSGKVIDLEYARGRYGKFFNIPDFAKVVAAIRALTKRSGLTIEGVEGPKKVYEFQDQWAKARREPRLSGYDGKEISIELYAR